VKQGELPAPKATAAIEAFGVKKLTKAK